MTDAEERCELSSSLKASQRPRRPLRLPHSSFVISLPPPNTCINCSVFPLFAFDLRPHRAGVNNHHPAAAPTPTAATLGSRLADAKQRFNVANLWRVLGLPGVPAKSCRCPLHPDKNASFSVYVGQTADGALRWKCHAGCGQGGPVELIARVLDLSERDACRHLLELDGHGLRHAGGPLPSRSSRRLAAAAAAAAELRRHPAPSPPADRQIVWPATGLRAGSPEDFAALAKLRGLSIAGIELAAERGLLAFADTRDARAWVVTDSTRLNAQARRLDGRDWEHLGGSKAWTLPGSRAAWPVGALESTGKRFVVLVEGGADLLAAHHLIAAEERRDDVAAVAMLGASGRIPDEALDLLKGKTVRLYPHDDPAGFAAAARWTAQLETADCDVDRIDFAGMRRGDHDMIKDLNDFARLAASVSLEVLP